jgi:uncharacterized membrane protein
LVPPIQIAYDIAGTVAYYGLVPLLWIVLFLVAWEDGPFARSLGFGPRTFWLLVPGVVLAFVAELPFAQFDGDYLAINIGGGLIPLVLACVLFARFAPPRARTLPAFLILFGAECASALAIVLFVSDPGLQDIGVTVVAAAATVAAVFLPARLGFDRAVATLVGLTSGVLAVTFLITAAVPGVGISAPFPADLVAPAAAGVIAALLGTVIFDRPTVARSIPLAYAAGTFGVIMGADLLRQPPLYGSGPSGLYVIGGANLLDLVYLSGLLAFAAAYLAYRSTGLPRTPTLPAETEEPHAPTRLLADAIRLRFAEEVSESIRQSRAAARAAAGQSQRLLGRPPAPEDRPWEGLPVPGWVVADQANLDALAQADTSEPAEAERAAQMARMLVGLGRFLNAPRFASIGARLVAFVIDLVVVTVPALLVGLVLLNGLPASTSPLSSLPLITASYGFIALAFLYFVVMDLLWGTTVGKYLLRIEVRERAAESLGLISSFVRESPKLLDLSALGVLGPVLLAVVLGRTVGLAGLNVSGGIAAFALGGAIALVFALTGATACVAISASSDRQRLGDRMAATLVVKRATPRPRAPPGAEAPSGASGS